MNILKTIKSILKEGFNIQEAQKAKTIEPQTERLFSEIKLHDLEPDEIKSQESIILSEVKEKINFKLNAVLKQNFTYQNFQIVKLGDFAIKNNGEIHELSFQMPNMLNGFSFIYLYIYNDRVIELKLGSQFIDKDNVLENAAKKYISNNRLILNRMGDEGKIEIIETFNSKNIIDFTDYSSIKRPEVAKKEPELAKEKSEYRVGRTIKHPKFGKGTILKREKQTTLEDGSTPYKVTIRFDDKDRVLMLNSTKKEAI